MSPDSSSGNQRWNLGKQYQRPEPTSPAKSKPERKQRENLPPARRDSAPPPIPYEEGDEDFFEKSATEKLPSKVAPQFHGDVRELEEGALPKLRAPRNFREFIEHPLTLIGAGFLCIILLLAYFFSATRPVRGPERYIPTANDSAGFIAQYFDNRSKVRFNNENIEVLPPENQAIRHGRFLSSTGETILAISLVGKMVEAGEPTEMSNMNFVPRIAYDTPLPEEDPLSARYWASARESMAYHLTEIGEDITRKVLGSEIPPTEWQQLGQRLLLEGLAVIEAVSAQEQSNTVPQAKGAAGRLQSLSDDLSDAQIEQLIRQAFPEAYAESLLNIRNTYVTQ